MPIYPTYKTYRGGFYDNKNINGVDDRVYTAKDIRKPYDTVFTDGILPEADGTAGNVLKVTATGGLNISIATGNAKLGGAWFENEGDYNITLDTAGSTDRYDCVIIRNDDNDNVRGVDIYINSLSAVPTINDLIRTDTVYEICVAYVRVPAFATAITDANIIDTREDGSLCNTMRGVGATVVRSYRNTYFSKVANETNIPIGINQYNKSRDVLTVAVEGRVFAEGVNYTIVDNSTVKLAIGLPVVGTRIDFEVTKNVNAAGADTVVQEVGELRKEMTAANRILTNYYYCNGVNDNINISNIVKAFLGLSFYHSMKLHIIGRFGFTQMAGGAGTSSNPYKLFDLGTFTDVPKPKVILDFTECEEISAPIDNGSYTVIFGGSAFDIIGANIYAANTTADTVIRVFDNAVKRLKAEDCRFWITGYKNSLIATNGTFINCRGDIANVTENSYCFLPSNYGLLRITGGEYYAYTGVSTKQSAIVGQSDTEAVSILYGVSAPTISRSGFYQTNSLLQWAGGGIMNCTDLVSALPMVVVSGISNIRGTIAKSKSNFT